MKIEQIKILFQQFICDHDWVDEDLWSEQTQTWYREWVCMKCFKCELENLKNV